MMRPAPWVFAAALAVAVAPSASATVPSESRDRTEIERARAVANYERDVALRRRELEEQKTRADSLMGMSWAEYQARRLSDGGADLSPGLRASAWLSSAAADMPAGRNEKAANPRGGSWIAEIVALLILAAGFAAIRVWTGRRGRFRGDEPGRADDEFPV